MKINLLPKEERPLKQSDVRWEFLVGLIGFLVLGIVLVFSWLEKAQVDQLNITYQEALQREGLLQNQVQVVNQLRATLTGLEAKVQTYADLMEPVEANLNSLSIVTEHTVPRLWLSTIVWQSQGVELIGYTQDMTSLSQYLYYLNEHSEQVRLSALYPSEGTDFMLFSIEVEGALSHGTLY